MSVENNKELPDDTIVTMLADHYHYLDCPMVVDPTDLEDCANVAAETIRFLRAAGFIKEN